MKVNSFEEFMAIATGLVTVQKSQKFLKCCVFVRPLYHDLFVLWNLIILHGRPLGTSLSSMGDFIILQRYYRPWTSFLLLGWFLILLALLALDDPFGRTGVGTNFPLPHQLPLCSKGRPGYCRDFNKILLFCEPRVAKLLVGQSCRSRFPKEPPRVNFWVASVVSLTLLLGPINSAFSFMPLTFLSFSLLPSRLRALSSSPSSSIRYLLFLFRFLS